MKSKGKVLLHVIEALVLALFLTVAAYMLIVFTVMLFAKGPGDGEMLIVSIYTMPLYPLIFVCAATMSLGARGGRRGIRIASLVMLAWNLWLIVSGWIKNLVLA
jgi:hypothetical protein